VILDTLRARAERHHLTFGPDPSTHSRCSLGGMIGNPAARTRCWRKDRRQRPRAADSPLRRDGADRRRHLGRRAGRHRARRRRRGQICSALQSITIGMPRRFALVSRTFRAAYPASISISSCGERLYVARALVGRKAPAQPS
jgi:hypothetical protein